MGKESYCNYPSWNKTLMGNKQATKMESKVTKFTDYQPTAGWYLSFQQRERVPH